MKNRACDIFIYAFLLLFSLAVTTAASGQSQVDDDGFETFEYKAGDTTYQMKKYYLCFLKSGTTRSQSEEEALEIQNAHLAHLQMLADKKLICMSGPLAAPESDIRGVVIYSVTSLEEAQKWAAKDPAVQAGRLEVEILPWWAAKGSTLF